MMRVVLHLLLVLGLVCNAVAPATAAHGHASHGHGAGAMPPVSQQVAPEAHEHAHHHDHASAHTDAASATAVDTDPAATSHDCCNGAACQCGCALPPAVARETAALPTPQCEPALLRGIAPLALIRGGSPPFRPPAA